MRSLLLLFLFVPALCFATDPTPEILEFYYWRGSDIYHSDPCNFHLINSRNMMDNPEHGGLLDATTHFNYVFFTTGNDSVFLCNITSDTSWTIPAHRFIEFSAPIDTTVFSFVVEDLEATDDFLFITVVEEEKKVIRVYDILDPFNPKFKGMIYVPKIPRSFSMNDTLMVVYASESDSVLIESFVYDHFDCNPSSVYCWILRNAAELWGE